MSFINKLFGNTETSSGEKEDKNTFIDPRDGHVYKTVKIGSQIIMAENLAFKTENGCWAYDNVSENISKYGYLYNWETATKVCPSGWHLPGDDEWTTLITFSGGELVAGNKLKEADTTNWHGHVTGATNETGFTALPGGFRFLKGSYRNIGYSGYWRSASEYDEATAWIIYMNSDTGSIYKNYNKKTDGFSVRCIKD